MGAPIESVRFDTPPESLSIAPFASTPIFSLVTLTLSHIAPQGTYPFTATIQYKDAANSATIFTAVASGSLTIPEPASVFMACIGLLLFIGRFKSLVKQQSFLHLQTLSIREQRVHKQVASMTQELESLQIARKAQAQEDLEIAANLMEMYEQNNPGPEAPAYDPAEDGFVPHKPKS